MVKPLNEEEVSIKFPGSRVREGLFSPGIPSKKNEGDDKKDEVKVKRKSRSPKGDKGLLCPQSEGGSGTTNINICLIDPRQSPSPKVMSPTPNPPNPPVNEKKLQLRSQALRYGIVGATVVCIFIGSFWIWSHYRSNCDLKLEQERLIHNFTLVHINQAQLLKDQQKNITKEKDAKIIALQIKLARLNGHVDVFRNQTVSNSDVIEGQRVVNNHLFEEKRKMEELIGRLEREKIELIRRHVQTIKTGVSIGVGVYWSSSYLGGVVPILLLHNLQLIRMFEINGKIEM